MVFVYLRTIDESLHDSHANTNANINLRDNDASLLDVSNSQRVIIKVAFFIFNQILKYTFSIS